MTGLTGDDDLARPAWLVGLAESKATPDDVIEELVRRAAAASQGWPPGYRQRAEPFTLDRALIRRPDLGVAHARALAALSSKHLVRLVATGVLPVGDLPTPQRTWPGVLLAALEVPGFPAELDAAVLDLDHHRRTEASRAAHLPPRLREALARDAEPTVVAAAVGSRRADPELVARAAGHPDPVVLAAVACSEHVQPDALARLAAHPHRRVQGAVARSPRLTADIAGAVLTRLRSRLGGEFDALRDTETAEALARNPLTPADVLAELARDFAADVYVLRSVAAHPHSPMASAEAAAVLGRLLAYRPTIGLDELTDLAAGDSLCPWLLPRIAIASSTEVRDLAASRDPRRRRLVAWRRDLPLDVLLALAADPDPGVLVGALRDPRVPAHLLADAAARHGRGVVAVVAEHPTTDAATLTALAERCRRPGRRNARVMGAVARHASAPAAVLVDCLDHPRARAAVARHPAIPLPALAGVLGDPDDVVARAAASNPSLPPAWARGLLAGRLP